MLACKGIFTTPSIDVSSRKTAKSRKAFINFALQNLTYINYSTKPFYVQVCNFEYKRQELPEKVIG